MSRDAVLVREAILADADDLSRLGSRAFRETNEPIIGAAATDAAIAQIYSEPALRACIRSCAQTADSFFLIATHNDELVGFLHYETVAGTSELHRIYAHPDRKGNGIGTTLLHALHNRIPSQTSYRLIVAVENHEARRFYKRHGFHEETRLDNAYFPGVALPREDVPSVPVLILRKTTS